MCRLGTAGPSLLASGGVRPAGLVVITEKEPSWRFVDGTLRSECNSREEAALVFTVIEKHIAVLVLIANDVYLDQTKFGRRFASGTDHGNAFLYPHLQTD
jgi:hypothetical protein